MTTNLIHPLNQGWRFRAAMPSELVVLSRNELPPNVGREGTWMPARVPGLALSSLVDAGIVPPVGQPGHETAAAPWESQDFLYRCSFLLPDDWTRDLTRPMRRFVLDLASLDTFAVVYLNGMLLGDSDNAFLPAAFDVTSILQPGENVIVVHLRSTLREALRLQAADGELVGDFDTSRLHVRRPQYQFGWNMAGRAGTPGITGPVRLLRERMVSIDHMHVPIKGLTTNDAQLLVETDVECLGQGAVEFEAVIDRIVPLGSGRQYEYREEWSKKKVLDLTPGRFRYSERVALEKPALWWPLGVGERGRRVLYRARVIARMGGEVIAEHGTVFGLRRVDLTSETESGDHPFTFKINGEPFFSRGAIVVPPALDASAVTDEEYVGLVDQAALANVNMLRVWGGGSYLPEAFYRRCDEQGIMVWQDFMFSRGEAPETKDFWSNVQREARHQVRRLRNHPSIVLWCGNDAGDWLAHRLANGAKARGSKIFSKLLPAVLKDYDGQRPYWRSSPSGGIDPNSPVEGDHHRSDICDVWTPGAPFPSTRARFVSEFGCASLPGRQTLDTQDTSADPKLDSPAFAAMQKNPGENERIFRRIVSGVRAPETIDETIYLSQWVQATALSTSIDHWRAARPMTMGALIWHFNDCWPGITSSLVDANRRAKLALWAVREAYSPLSLALLATDDGFRAVALSDGAPWDPKREMICRFKAYKLDGELLRYEEVPVTLAPNGKAEIGLFTWDRFGISDLSNSVVVGELCEGDYLLAGRLVSPLVPAQTHLKAPELEGTLDCIVGQKRAILVLRGRNVIRGVELKLEGVGDAVIRFENGFDIWPSREVWVQVDLPGGVQQEAFMNGFRYRCLNDACGGRKIEWRTLPMVESEHLSTQSHSSFTVPIARVRLSDVVRKLENP